MLSFHVKLVHTDNSKQYAPDLSIRGYKKERKEYTIH